MWFLFGIVSFVLFFTYRLWRKYYWSWGWSGDDGYLRVDNRQYKNRYKQNKGEHYFGYAVSCPPGFYFRIKRENQWDRRAKLIGLSVERQLADPDFDTNLYLASDDPGWHERLSSDPELRTLIKELFRDAHVKSLTCEGQHLWLEAKVLASEIPLEYLNGAVVKHIVSGLHTISDNLSALAKQSGIRHRDPYAWRSIALVSLSSAAFMLATAEWFRFYWIETRLVILDWVGLLVLALPAALLMLFLLLAISAAWLRGSSHAHIVMLEILITGGLGITMSSYALLRDANCNFDRSVSTTYSISITNKYMSHHRRGPDRFYLDVSAPSAADIPSRIEVDRGTYRRAEIGSNMVIYIKPGYLGYRWIEAIEGPYKKQA
jgi:hypothetical protein